MAADRQFVAGLVERERENRRGETVALGCVYLMPSRHKGGERFAHFWPIIFGAFFNPPFDQGDLSSGKRIVLLRHSVIGVFAGNQFIEFALIRRPWHNRPLLAFTAFHETVE